MIPVANEQPKNVTAAITSAVGGKLGQGAYKLIIGGAIAVGVCSIPFVAVGWFTSGDAPTVASVVPMLNRVEAQPAVVPTLVQYGYESASAALNHCAADETVIEWRGGFSCNKDMDKYRQQ